MPAKPRSPEVVSFALAVFFAAVLNVPFWRLLYRVVEPSRASEWLFIAAVFIAVLLLSYLISFALAVRLLFKPLMSVLLPLTAAASYFMLEYGVVIDAGMIQNVFETDAAEAGDLISGQMLMYVAGLGLLPAFLLWRTSIAWRPWREDAARKAKSAAVLLPLATAVLFPFASNLTSVFRENRDVRLTLTPSNYLTALDKYLRSKSLAGHGDVAPFAGDARRYAAGAGRGRKSLFVIAVGETARADHFSLNGYSRQTNPELAKVADLINFPDAMSCGTDTAQSVPCMFSGLGRKEFTNARAAGRENLLDILKRTGIDIVWRENQAGCKGVCARVATEILTGRPHPLFNVRGETHDEILLEGLAEKLKGLTGDTVIVMHMTGSHGPAYWKRYPDRFEVFKPVCRESQFSRCSTEEIVNAYDNTILYSDHVLARLIAILEAADAAGTADTGLIYMSDHGESLGESNIYLHGMPYAFAPAAQTHVPAFLWLSKNLEASAATDTGCLGKSASSRISHDNLFHSVLGIMGVEMSAYDPALDLFARCRTPRALSGPDRGGTLQ